MIGGHHLALLMWVGCASPLPIAESDSQPPRPPPALAADAAVADAVAPSVTSVLPPELIRQLVGCWRWRNRDAADFDEEWTLRAKGSHGVEVVRELGATRTEAARARIPRDLMYDPTTGLYAFHAAGSIHGLLFVFRLEHDGLAGELYFNADGRFAPSGTFTVERCR